MNSIHIKNARLLDPSQHLDRTGDIYIDRGLVVALDDAPDGFEADIAIDATGSIAIPGIIDLASRLREPGAEHKADIASETIAAVSSGITRLCCTPDTDPVIDEPSVIDLINHKATLSGKARVSTIAALTAGLNGEQLSEMYSLKEAGCIGVSNARRSINNTLILKRAFSYAQNCDLTVFIEPTDHFLSDQGNAHDGPIATRLGLSGIPVSAETCEIARCLEIIAETGVRAHFGRLSAAKSVELIRRAKQDGLHVTADVSAHQLFLTQMDISSFNSTCHVLPPLRTERDKEALRAGVTDGTIDAICSDHQPHEVDAKHSPFASTEPGISSLETLLPLSLKLVEENIIDANTMVRALCNSPADIIGSGDGHLMIDAPADICLIDMGREWVLETNKMKSRGRNTPFSEWGFRGCCSHTIIDGELVFQRD